MPTIAERLHELGLVVPTATAPMALYVPARRVGQLVYTAGQVSRGADREFIGKVGADVSLEDGQAAARLCALNCLSALLTVIDSLDRVTQLVRVGGFVNAAPGFVQVPQVVNGASELFIRVFGDAGKHARTAVGVAELPSNYAVEVELIAQVE